MQTLWEEKKCLQEILYELHGNGGSHSAMFGTPKTVYNNTRGNTKRMFQDALVYAKVHYEEDANHLTFQYHQSQMLELLKKRSFCLEELISLRDCIVAVLGEENELLEDAIIRLKQMVDNSMEIGVESSSSLLPECSPPRKSTSTQNPIALDGSAIAKKSMKQPLVGKRDTLIADNYPKIPSKSVTEIQKSFERISIVREKDSIDKYFCDGSDSVVVTRSCNNHGSPSERSPTASLTGSKFRQRLRVATAELYLVDDF